MTTALTSTGVYPSENRTADTISTATTALTMAEATNSACTLTSHTTFPLSVASLPSAKGKPDALG